MTSTNRGNADHLSAESYYALLTSLTLIKAQAQMIARLAHRTAATDFDVALRRLGVIEQTVDGMVRQLDAMQAPESEVRPDAAAKNGSGAA